VNGNVKKIVVVTGSRADYGLLRPTLRALDADARFELQLLVSATHLQPEYGLTLTEIEADGFTIAGRVETVEVRDAEDLARSLAAGIRGFTERFVVLEPNVLLVLGDRHEALSAALAATGVGIPIAHIHGGELSEGSVDDAQRHCLTKLAHIHFVATRLYGERVCQLGEQPERVFDVGAPAVEAIRTLPLLGREALEEALGGVTLERPLIALTLHPPSLEPGAAAHEASEVVEGLDRVIETGGSVVVTLPGDDLGNVETRRVLLAYADRRANVHPFAALGQLRYLSLLLHADAVLGNSSSGLIEAPSFRLPVVNVGNRQTGRLRTPNVIDSTGEAGAVADALTRALDPAFRASLADMRNPYGEGEVSARIVEVLAGSTQGLRQKRFFDVPDGPWRTELVLGSDPR
jgi:GDP/UDP-N,N'-diacetylbacillosamine 2-epimerase (hydrolysing)